MQWKGVSTRKKAEFAKWAARAGLLNSDRVNLKRRAQPPQPAKPKPRLNKDTDPTPLWVLMLREAAEEAAKREILNAQIVEFLDRVGSMNTDGSFNSR
ncbi:hypothetical protein DXG03_003574 [Asterophora parasitica]|uniref:Uncharacterized protein n=1 Tax=Asterophora parasitica TaxID=117018 RepID=A0A9P7G1G0_9AGAR|nr:hypothetical protein DXG03_003574 [Asterophora parasitica]